MNATSTKPKAIVVCGPTGVGKTSLTIDLALAFQGEIVGADSMQVYRRMDIGTAKPTPDERARVVHHMVDIVDPDEPFDAETFAGMALEIVLGMRTRAVTPFVAGGTGLYIRALECGLFAAPPVDMALRERLKQEAQKAGTEALLQRLRSVDPAAAARLHPHDTYRVMRALEIFELTGSPMSAQHRAHRFEGKRLTTLKLGLKMARPELYDRIDRRVDMMVADGLLDEVQGLLAAGYQPGLKSMQSIGYRHMLAYLAGELDWARAVETLKRDTRRYAKRQFTWFRADKEIVWIEPVVTSELKDRIRAFLNARSAGTIPGRID